MQQNNQNWYVLDKKQNSKWVHLKRVQKSIQTEAKPWYTMGNICTVLYSTHIKNKWVRKKIMTSTTLNPLVLLGQSGKTLWSPHVL